jgi:hypothetical protein
MFIRHSVHIEHPIAACTDALMSGAREWFPHLTEKNVGSVGIHIAGLPVRKRVVVTVGEPIKTATWTVIPLSWKATFPEHLFPAMTGRIELAPADKNVSRLTVSGMYEPPLGKLGKQLDATVMQGTADGTVKELAESIAQRIDAAVSAHAKLVLAPATRAAAY